MYENLEQHRFALSVPANSADLSIVAAVTGKRIIVTSLILCCGGTATTIQFQSKAGVSAGVNIGPLFSMPANGIVPLEMIKGLFETVAGSALVADSSNNAAISVSGTYVLC